MDIVLTTQAKILICAVSVLSLLQCGDERTGSAGGGGAVAGGAAPTAGAPGEGGGGGEPCTPPVCEGFDESTCEASSSDCTSIFGVQHSGPGETEFAGCLSNCCLADDDCEGWVLSETCAHPGDNPANAGSCGMAASQTGG